MLWEVEIRSAGRDSERERVCDEFDLLTASQRGGDLIAASARGFWLEGEFDLNAADKLVSELLHDPLTETATICELGKGVPDEALTVLLKPGVMDPVAESVVAAARDLGVAVEQVRTFRRYFPRKPLLDADYDLLVRKILVNEAIEQVAVGPVLAEHLTIGQPYIFRRIEVPLRDCSDAELEQLSKSGQLALTLDEMRAIQAHFRQLGREPTDIELETLAQTWSEHCSHKTLKGTIEYRETIDGTTEVRRYGNLLKETIFAATQQLRQRFGKDDWCVSVFQDNAGVVKFNDRYHLCFKVETHNRPSAIEPYGGANTGIGGVIRDPMGTGLGAKPICNTDVFCFAPPDYPPQELPPGVLHPRRIMQGVVAGVRDYGNRMGIPTVNGAIYFDERYLGNPLVFCGTVGLIPVDRMDKQPRAGDYIVTVGGRTGRDGIHGATFSSLELTSESEKVSGGAVQIGNAIAEKKLLDVLLQARDRGLYSAITDCGAGGFSSAIGEMGAQLGAVVQLDQAPLKYEGLSYTEIWISESQERMILAVPPQHWPELEALCRSEGVEAAILGRFEATGKLQLFYQGHAVGELDLHFLHEGRPNRVRPATFTLQPTQPVSSASPAASPSGTSLLAASPCGTSPLDALATLKKILSSYTVASKEWVIRQYDHEVQGGSVIKPLVGMRNDGPSDAAVVMPILGQWRGVAIGNGLNPRYNDLDPAAAAECAIDEAIRNVVAVGADPKRVALLDNFCWGNVHHPETLGSLVRAAQACHDVALAYETPFISGKDSLNNEFRSPQRTIAIPGTLLISALGIVPDVRRCVTMDLKAAGNVLFVLGVTRDELGGSHYHMVHGYSGGAVPRIERTLAPRLFAALHTAISAGLVRSCHDLSEGGLAVALAEMAFAGGIGADVTGLHQLIGAEACEDRVRLFSESPSRFVVEVEPMQVDAFRRTIGELPLTEIGKTVAETRLRIAGANGEWLIWAKLAELREAWHRPLRW